MKKIVLITGGQRSGKSGYAQKTALELAENPVYLATSRIWDEEHRARIERHRAERGAAWTTLEIEKTLSGADLRGRVVVVDCVTLWATNFFFDNDSQIERTEAELTAEFDRLTAQEAVFLFVTNEIGMGEMAQNVVQRRFADLQGRINQYIATRADEVILMVSGIPVKIQ
jgi:adenosylcobinamide kinase/adenosylcobinamide-phosphate guanylyltransferase